MTTTELRTKLVTDPNFIFSYIYGNNPDSVIENLRGLGFVINNAEDVFHAINALHEEGRTADLQAAFTVPLLTDQLDPGELAVINEVITSKGGKQRRSSSDGSNGINWGAVAASAVGLIGAFTGQPVVQQQNANDATKKEPEPAKSNTTTYILIGVAVVVVGVVLYLVLRKK